ncbi:hypothetical protein PAECIP111802_07047 [Paenibacillus allorhizosphaerae]|uniref:HTH tetR-type domain-containing protein n=1 Tax=Paenibacillus allorhizosphaerae TaxID=2849866 RepID=A0ABM8VU75_9BACL|nr:hypothetical protein PAECIP111802_07047 [Paenibacillus allorhizosphaerae]
MGRFGLELGGEERTQREIAKEPGISRSYRGFSEKRALMKLYHEFYKVKRQRGAPPLFLFHRRWTSNFCEVFVLPITPPGDNTATATAII